MVEVEEVAEILFHFKEETYLEHVLCRCLGVIIYNRSDELKFCFSFWYDDAKIYYDETRNEFVMCYYVEGGVYEASLQYFFDNSWQIPVLVPLIQQFRKEEDATSRIMQLSSYRREYLILCHAYIRVMKRVLLKRKYTDREREHLEMRLKWRLSSEYDPPPL